MRTTAPTFVKDKKKTQVKKLTIWVGKAKQDDITVDLYVVTQYVITGL